MIERESFYYGEKLWQEIRAYTEIFWSRNENRKYIKSE